MKKIYKTISATEIGKKIELQPNEVNNILVELGYQEKGTKGGYIILKEHFGEQLLYKGKTPFVSWNALILRNKAFLKAVDSYKGSSKEEKKPFKFDRGTFKAEFRSVDGHFVRSQGEVIIDNWLYMNGILHAYERRVPIEEELYSDFYLPQYKIYIEYEGMVGEKEYDKRQKTKRKLYEKYNLNLIELFPEDIKNIDDILPLKLLKFGVQVS